MEKNGVSHGDNGIDLKVIKEQGNGQDMSKVVLLVEKTNKNTDKLFQMFMQDKEILLKKLRAGIGKSSLYRMFSFRIDEINGALRSINDSLFFVERGFIKKNSRMVMTYRIHPDCSINEGESFFLLEFKPQLAQDKPFQAEP